MRRGGNSKPLEYKASAGRFPCFSFSFFFFSFRAFRFFDFSVWIFPWVFRFPFSHPFLFLFSFLSSVHSRRGTALPGRSARAWPSSRLAPSFLRSFFRFFCFSRLALLRFSGDLSFHFDLPVLFWLFQGLHLVFRRSSLVLHFYFISYLPPRLLSCWRIAYAYHVFILPASSSHALLDQTGTTCILASVHRYSTSVGTRVASSHAALALVNRRLREQSQTFWHFDTSTTLTVKGTHQHSSGGSLRP